MRWGFRPSWAKPSRREPINARSETLHEKPMFRAAAQRRRGVFPADGWYEWMTTPQGKTPWFHQRADGQACLMAVVWDTWTDGVEQLESCVLLTQAATEDCRDVHDRMPVLLNISMSTTGSRGQVTVSAAGHRLTPPGGQVPSTGSVRTIPVLIRALPRLFDHEYGA